MRVRKIAIGVAALVVATGVTLAARAGASAPTTLYVGTTGCSDSGSGTQATPYCTVAAAIAVVQPGQTVMVSGSHDEAVVVNRSGASGTPITFSSFGSGFITGPDAGVTLEGVHDVVWSIGITSSPTGLVVHNSTRVTVRSETVLLTAGATTPAISLLGTTDSTVSNTQGRGPDGAILLDAATSGVTVTGAISIPAAGVTAPGIDVFGSQNKILNSNASSQLASGPFVRIEPGATGNVVADNRIAAKLSTGIDDNGAGTDIVNNTISSFCDAGINIGSTATGTSVENNIVTGTQACTDSVTEHVGIGVFGAATASTTVDYNTVTTTAPNLPYAWNTGLDTLDAFRQASGQGAHDSAGSATLVPAYTSPNTDSADSAAPGFQPTDINGKARVDNPIAANTGAGPTTYADRGAVEAQPAPAAPLMGVATQTLLTGDPSPSWSVSETVTVTANWAPVVSLSTSFGDGTPPVSQSAAPDASGTVTATFTHVYHGAALWPITTSALDSIGVTGIGTINTDLQAPRVVFLPDFTPTATLAAGVPFSVESDSAWGWSGASTFTINFGDGTSPVTANPADLTAHTYQKPGTYTVTAVQSGGGISYAAPPAVATVGNGPGRYTALAPTRILDTRNAIGVATKTPLAGGHTLSLAVTGAHGVPANAIAVAVNLTATQGKSSGFLTAYPDGKARPNASDLNWITGATVPNFVIVPVSNGKIDLYNGGTGSVHLLVDLAGYYSLAGDDFTATGPSRVIDTRTGVGVGQAVPVQPGQVVKLDLGTAFPGVTGLDAVTFNVTVTQPSKSGFLTVYPDGTTRPTASNLNWAAGQTIANMATVANHNGTVDFYNGSAGTVQLIVDAFGSYQAGTASEFATQDPTRVLDTRNRIGVGTTTPLGAHQSVTFSVPDSNDVDLFNVTVTGGTAAGYLSLVPFGASPTTSNLNWARGQTIANTALVSVSSPGEVTVYNGSSGTVHVLVDQLGTFSQDVAH